MVLVHGYLASPVLMWPLAARLRDFGHDVHLVPEISVLGSGDVRTHAVELDRAVKRVVEKTGSARVHVVGTSQGGIIALQWAIQTEWSRVDRLVTMGTPFRGSPLASAFCRPFGGRLLRWISPGAPQLVPGSALLDELARAPLQRPVTSISMEGDRVCPPAQCVLDGMSSVVLEGGYGWMTHQFLMVDTRVTAAVHRALLC